LIWPLSCIVWLTDWTPRKCIVTRSKFEAPVCRCPNNIAEGSGSVHPKEFKQFLNITRRSLFEDASMLLVFERLGLIGDAEVSGLLNDCDKLSRKVTNFSRSLGT
jgi:four helix bundle protein